MLSQTAPYNSHSHFVDGLLEVVRILGTWLTPNPDDAFSAMAAENYQHGNRTIADDLLEEIIIRLGNVTPGGGGGSSIAEILRSNTDLSGAVSGTYLFGYNHTNGKMFIKNGSNNWQQVGQSASLIFENTDTTSVEGDGSLGNPYKVHVIPAQFETNTSKFVVNNFARSEPSAEYVGPYTYSFENSELLILTGIQAASIDGVVRHLRNDGNSLIILNANDSRSDAGNRFISDNIPVFMMPGDVVTLQYNSVIGGWSILSSNLGRGGAQFDVFSDMYSLAPWGGQSSGGGGVINDGLSQVSGYKGTVAVHGGTSVGGQSQITTNFGTVTPVRGPANIYGRIMGEQAGTPDNTDYSKWALGFTKFNSGVLASGFCWMMGSTGPKHIAIASAGTGSAESETVIGGLNAKLFDGYISLGVYVYADWQHADYYYRVEGSNQIFYAGSKSISPSLADQSFSPGVYIRKMAGSTQMKVHVDFLGERYDNARQ